MAAHKRNFLKYIDPGYETVEKVKVATWRAEFQKFMDTCMAEIPNEGEPKDAYAYNSHLGQFTRSLDNAKDEFIKALLAYHYAR